jgi:hypothetical protein
MGRAEISALLAHISSALTGSAMPSEGSIQILHNNSFFKPNSPRIDKNFEPEKYIIPNKRDKYTFLGKVNQQGFVMTNTQIWTLDSSAIDHMTKKIKSCCMIIKKI